MSELNHFDEKAHNPTFSWAFLHPKYWGTWLTLFLGVLLSFLPHSARKVIATFIAKRLVTLKRGATKRARINLELCFPDKTQAERDEILLKQFITAGCYLLGFASLSVRPQSWLNNNTIIRGEEHLNTIKENNESAILLVPHTWAIDIPAVLLASRGFPVSAMAKAQHNALYDWLMHKQRVQYGGRVYERSGGIRPFIRSIKDGYLGYYLPDEDLGPEHSVFVDFFGTTKATMSGLGQLSKLSRAKIVPLLAMYNLDTGKYEIDIQKPLSPFPTGDESQDARMMNQCIEDYVSQHPEQYMWILRLLKTRPNNEPEPY